MGIRLESLQEASYLRSQLCQIVNDASCCLVGATKFQKLKFKTYINKEKGTQEIVKRLFDNSKKYGTSNTVGAKNQNPNKSKHICNKCKFRQLNNISITGSKRRVHPVLKCESCGTVWNAM
ncbi:hypothetical protein AB4K20DRAFT_1983443 [Rhizopus microsporus]